MSKRNSPACSTLSGRGQYCRQTTPEAFRLGWQRIEQQAKEIGKDLSKMPRCLYYNCHIDEDRKAAFREPKEFLDAYYTADFSEQQLNV